MKNLKLKEAVRIKDSYYEHNLRGKTGVVISEPKINAFLGDVTVIRLPNYDQISLSSEHLELIDPPKLVFRKDDLVRFKETTPNHYWRGREATVVNDVDEKDTVVDLKIKATGRLMYGAHVVNLERVEKTLNEGDEIDPKDIEVGMVVKVTYTSTSGDYEQTSTKQGKVVRISKGISGNVYPYVKGNLDEIHLSFDSIHDQVYTLIKHAPKIDEILEEIKEAKPGSVVQIEDGGAAKIILTYVKTEPSQNGSGRWLALDSRYTTSSLLSDTTVRSKMQKLDQLIIKH